jgi:hypothetical protein
MAHEMPMPPRDLGKWVSSFVLESAVAVLTALPRACCVPQVAAGLIEPGHHVLATQYDGCIFKGYPCI